MVQDIVGKYGYLTLGSRLKRIGEQLQAQSHRIAREMGAQVLASHYPFLRAIDELGPLTLGDLAHAVGITQPGATRTVNQLVKTGMLTVTAAPDDGRIRIISLTQRGEEQVTFGKHQVWPRIEAAVADLCADLDGALLDQLGAIEAGLETRPLDRRPSDSTAKTNP